MLLRRRVAGFGAGARTGDGDLSSREAVVVVKIVDLVDLRVVEFPYLLGNGAGLVSQAAGHNLSL